VVKAMVKRGLLCAEPDPSHGRRIVISLHPSALPLAQELQLLATDLKAGLTAGLDPEQQAVLRQGLIAMITNLDGMLLGNANSPAGHEAVASH
jgi:DNA-binding MarR family transcriptional regulator